MFKDGWDHVFQKFKASALSLAVSSSPKPWIDVFALPEKSNMAVTESDPDPRVRKMSINF